MTTIEIRVILPCHHFGCFVMVSFVIGATNGPIWDLEEADRVFESADPLTREDRQHCIVSYEEEMRELATL